MSKKVIINQLYVNEPTFTMVGEEGSEERVDPAAVFIDTREVDTVNFAVKYTSGEDAKTLSIKVYGLLNETDISNAIQLGTYSINAGVATFTATTFNVVATTAGTDYTAHFSVGTTFPVTGFVVTEDTDEETEDAGSFSITAYLQ